MMPYSSKFNPHYKPTPPHRPSKYLANYTILETFSSSYPTKADFLRLVEKYGGDDYNWACEVDYYNYDNNDTYPQYPTLDINIRANDKLPNLKYEEQLAKYKIDYAEYKKTRSEWDEKKAQYDQILNAKKEAKELKMLEHLKKKYESED